MIPKKMAETLISTQAAINILSSILNMTKLLLQAKSVKVIKPGLVLVSINEDTDTLTSQSHEIDAKSHDQLLPMLLSVINGYADAGTQVVFFVMGAAADVTGFNYDDEDEREYGFVLRAVTIDGRQLSGFLKLYRDQNGVIKVDAERQAIIEVNRAAEDFEDDVIGTLASRFVQRYNERKNKAKEVLH